MLPGLWLCFITSWYRASYRPPIMFSVPLDRLLNLIFRARLAGSARFKLAQ
jgi:hypothetical protein